MYYVRIDRYEYLTKPKWERVQGKDALVSPAAKISMIECNERRLHAIIRGKQWHPTQRRNESLRGSMVVVC